MKKLLLAMIKLYQKHISSHLPARCRFYPTCSAYAFTAIEYYGVFKGGLLALWRILRCNPLSVGGYDPVPLPKNMKGSEQNLNNKEDN